LIACIGSCFQTLIVIVVSNRRGRHGGRQKREKNFVKRRERKERFLERKRRTDGRRNEWPLHGIQSLGPEIRRGGGPKNSRGGNGCTTSNGYVINDFSHELVSFAEFQFFLRCEFNVFHLMIF